MKESKTKVRVGLLAALTAVSALVLALGLTACGGAGGGDADKTPFVGTWDISSISGEEAVTEDDMKMMSDMGLNAFMNLDEDGTASIDLFGEVLQGMGKCPTFALAIGKQRSCKRELRSERNEAAKVLL